VVARELASAVRAALARLPDSQREVIYLHRFEQMSFAEIASVLDTSEGAVKLRAFRGYEKLREEILDFGCPHGSLCQELEKLEARSALAKAGARLLGVNLRFAERQLRALGHGNRASLLARDLVASLQGTLLLAHTMRSRAVLKERLSRIELWVDALPTRARRAS